MTFLWMVDSRCVVTDSDFPVLHVYLCLAIPEPKAVQFVGDFVVGRLSWTLAIFCLAGVKPNVIERRIRG